MLYAGSKVARASSLGAIKSGPDLTSPVVFTQAARPEPSGHGRAPNWLRFSKEGWLCGLRGTGVSQPPSLPFSARAWVLCASSPLVALLVPCESAPTSARSTIRSDTAFRQRKKHLGRDPGLEVSDRGQEGGSSNPGPLPTVHDGKIAPGRHATILSRIATQSCHCTAI